MQATGQRDVSGGDCRRKRIAERVGGLAREESVTNHMRGSLALLISTLTPGPGRPEKEQLNPSSFDNNLDLLWADPSAGEKRTAVPTCQGALLSDDIKEHSDGNSVDCDWMINAQLMAAMDAITGTLLLALIAGLNIVSGGLTRDFLLFCLTTTALIQLWFILMGLRQLIQNWISLIYVFRRSLISRG